MDCYTVSIVVILCCLFNRNFGRMSGNVPTISNRKITWGHVLEIIDNSWLAKCADTCVYEAGYLVEEDGRVLIDIEKWPKTRAGACWNKPCDEDKVCVADQQSKHCKEPNSSPCPEKWIKFEKKCYHFSYSMMSFGNAEVHCKGKGAKLAEPRTSSANHFMKSRVRKYKAANWWFGLSDQDVEGDWTWRSNGERPSFFDWKKNNPNEGLQANCGALWHLYDYGWADEPCQSNYRVICEMI